MRRLAAMNRCCLVIIMPMVLILSVAKTWAIQVNELNTPDAKKLAKLSVRDRLKLAADVSDELASKAQMADSRLFRQLALAPSRMSSERINNTFIFPITVHIRRYETVRPWSTLYSLIVFASRDQSPWVLKSWPDNSSAPELRELLRDSDPRIRSLAIESLATLHQPQDVELIASLLDDSAEGAAWLGWNQQLSAIPVFGVKIDSKINKIEVLRSWRKMQVRDYAGYALELMTGQKLDSKGFAAWWDKNKDARNSLWYWDQRINREMTTLKQNYIRDMAPRLSDNESRDVMLRYKKSRYETLKKYLTELHELSPEVEAKAVLMTDIRHEYTNGGVRIFNDSNVTALRISRSRFLDLMDRKYLWPDVDWQIWYEPFLKRLALLSGKLFIPEDVVRLKAVLNREYKDYGCYQLEIGISQLLPPAKGDLDAPDTKDGSLRAAINRLKESKLRLTAYTERGFLAAELINVGLPANWQFLKKMFFSEPEEGAFPRPQDSILNALGELPLTYEKRDALVDLVLDSRYRSLWIRPSRLMGDDAYREKAANSLNRHAGRILITQEDLHGLSSETTSNETLKTVISKIREWAKEQQSVAPSRR